MPRRSPTHRAAMGAALTLAVGLALAGCAATPEPGPTATKTPAAPNFASDEEAFAAAEEAFARLRAALTTATSSGSAEGFDFSDVAVGEGLEQANRALESFVEAGSRMSGDVTFDVRQQIRYFEDPTRGAVVQLHICEDISQTDVLDAEGNSQVVENRTTDIPYAITVEGPADRFLVSERTLWVDGNFCL